MDGLNLSTLLQVVQLGTIVIGGAMVLSALRQNVVELARRIDNIEIEVKKMVDVLVAIAKTDARLDNLERQIASLVPKNNG